MLRRTIYASTALGLTLVSVVPAFAQDTIDIPAQPLAAALTELATETGLQVTATGAAVKGKMSNAVRGPMTPEAALQEMLSGTGLSIRMPAENAAVLNFQDVVLQNATEDDTFDLGTLVLRGELIDRDVQDSRTSAVIIDGTTLESGVSVDFSNVIERTPGVTNTGSEIAIRGIQESPNGISGEKTVAVQVDGATFGVQSRLNSTEFSTWDLEQVEILRGPQSTQTGRNALAGAVIVRSRDPEYFREARLKLGYGSFGTGQAAIALNTPLVDDRLALRFSYDRTITDGEISSPDPTIDNIDSEEKTAMRLGLRWDPTDQLSAVLKFSRLEIEDGSLTVDSATLPDFVNTFDVRDRETAELDAVNLRVSYGFDSAWSIESTTSFSDFSSFGTFDADSSSLPLGAVNITNDSDWFEQEFKLLYETDRTSAVLGAYYYRENSRNDLILPLLSLNTTINEDTKNYALFAEIEHAFNDKWSIIGGFRYDVEEGSVDQVNIVGGFPIATALDYKFEAFLPKIGLLYSFDESRSIGLTYQRGYRSGGIGINRLGVANEFDPEFTDNYELSFRSEFYDGNLIVNANAFYTEWTDQQVRVRNPPFTNPNDTRIVNAGSSELFGAELDIRAQPTENLSLFGGLAYVQTEYTDFQLDSTTQLAGNSFPTSPEWTASFGGRYDFSSDWYISGSVSFTDNAFSSALNTPTSKIDSRTLVDLQVGVQRDNWHAYLFATNLFDEEYTLLNSATTSVRGSSRRIGLVLESVF